MQRVLIELLTQMDGFDQTTNVKVIMATNRADTLDPALLRPGRLDRKIEFPNPDRRQKRLIFQTITQKMNLADDVDLESCKPSSPRRFAAREDQRGRHQRDLPGGGHAGSPEEQVRGHLERLRQGLQDRRPKDHEGLRFL